MTVSFPTPSEDVMRLDLDAQGVLSVTLDAKGRAQNVLNQAFVEALGCLVERITNDSAVRGVLFASGKKDFMAGGDIEELFCITSAEETFQGTMHFHRLVRQLETCGKPTAAVVQGTALGGGLEFVLACHHRIVVNQPRAKYGLPEVKLGLLPGGGGTQRLPRLIGLQQALPLMLEGRDFDAEKGLALGVFQALVADFDTGLQQAREWLLAHPQAQQPWDTKGFKFPGGNAHHPANVPLVAGLPGMLKAKTRSLMPAPLNIASAVVEGSLVNIDNGLKIETRYFVDLATHPVTKNIIATTWVQLNALNKGGARPAGIAPRAVKKLGVLGAGMMGAGIAYAAANVGIEVVLKDITQQAAEQGKAYAQGVLSAAVRKGRRTETQMQEVLARIHPTEHASDLAGCDYVVEAVFEDRSLKARVTQEAEAVMDPSGIFGSNTSTLPITGLAQASGRPNQFIGIHFFSPVEKMPLVEIIVGRDTSPETLARTFDFVQQLKKTPIVVNDARGFYTTRVFATYVQEGLALLSEGQPAALIEHAGMAAGMPVGPLALADELSLGLMRHVVAQTRADAQAEGRTYVPQAWEAVVEHMAVRCERLGKKDRKGFYAYPEGGKKYLWSGLAREFPQREPIPAQDMADRLMFVQSLETVRCMQEKVVEHTADANIGSLFGWGFPPHLGGTLQAVNAYGPAQFAARAQALATQYGERFSPPALLQQMASNGQTF